MFVCIYECPRVCKIFISPALASLVVRLQKRAIKHGFLAQVPHSQMILYLKQPSIDPFLATVEDLFWRFIVYFQIKNALDILMYLWCSNGKGELYFPEELCNTVTSLGHTWSKMFTQLIKT